MKYKLNDDITLDLKWQLYIGSLKSNGQLNPDDPTEVYNIEATHVDSGQLYTLSSSEYDRVEEAILEHVLPTISHKH